MTRHGNAYASAEIGLEVDASVFDEGAGSDAPAAVSSYRQLGFIKVRNVLDSLQVDEFRAASIAFMERSPSYRKDAILDQRVNVWQHDEVLRRLTLDRRLASIAEQLAGQPLRLWHDQMLVKTAGDSRATEFHQDQPYWPHAPGSSALTAWIALVDVPESAGCMSFLPGSHLEKCIPRHELDHERGLFSLVPELEWSPRVTLPLRAGDCTFHDGRTAHFAGKNHASVDRIAHAVIYMTADTQFSGARHVVTNPLALTTGDELSGDAFPRVSPGGS